MSVSDLMEQMAKAGAPMEAIILAVRALEAKDAEIEHRRSVDRERKRRQRERVRDTDGTVTGQSRDTDGTVTDATPLALDKETPPTPPKEINPKPPATGTRARETGHRLPEDWRPTKLGRDTVSGQIIENRGQEWAKRALESFRNHWRSANGPSARKRDWQAAWANWVIEQDNRDGRRNGANGVGGNYRNGSSASGMGRTIDAAQRFVARGGPH